MVRKVREIMSPAPVCMAPADSAAAAAQAMRRHGTGTVLLVSRGRLSGLVTDRDITTRVLAEDRDPLAVRLAEICSSDLAVLAPDDDVARAAWLLRHRAVRRMPVLADGIPVGMVSVGDLALSLEPALEPAGSMALSGASG
jgi:CBS domain-containing protein